MKLSSFVLVMTVFLCLYFQEFALAVTAEKLMPLRLSPSSPEQMLTKIYNSVLSGDDHFKDIEVYMTRSLRSRYLQALKSVSKGKRCDVPKMLVNGIFSGKLRGFKIEVANKTWREAEVSVKIDTNARDLSNTSDLKRFDPVIYEKITFKFTRLLLDWKIDNIMTLQPILDKNTNIAPAYKKIDLRNILSQCQ